MTSNYESSIAVSLQNDHINFGVNVPTRKFWLDLASLTRQRPVFRSAPVKPQRLIYPARGFALGRAFCDPVYWRVDFAPPESLTFDLGP